MNILRKNPPDRLDTILERLGSIEQNLGDIEQNLDDIEKDQKRFYGFLVILAVGMTTTALGAIFAAAGVVIFRSL